MKSDGIVDGGTVTERRIGLVLGGGGVLGGAWAAGALSAVAEQLDRTLRELDCIVGTSAGSLLAAQIRCGMSPDELLDIEHRPVSFRGSAELDQLLSRGAPFALYPRIGSPRMLLSAMTRPLSVRPMALATAIMPRGRVKLDPVTQIVRSAVGHAEQRGVVFIGGWPATGQTWIVATNYDNGRRAVFGHPTGPRASLEEAVLASCSVPGWFAPTFIRGRRYVDGGVCSVTSLDLLRSAALDHIYVLAPLASLVYDRAGGHLARAERVIRRLVTRQLISEVRLVRRTGTVLTLLMPGPEDLARMGPNVMDPSRRAQVADTSMRTSRAALRALA